jgi:hypothetical protein
MIQSVATSLYMVILWFPLAMFIIFKIIFMKNNMDWGKTQHGTAKVVTSEIKSETTEKAEQLTKV